MSARLGLGYPLNHRGGRFYTIGHTRSVKVLNARCLLQTERHTCAFVYTVSSAYRYKGWADRCCVCVEGGGRCCPIYSTLDARLHLSVFTWAGAHQPGSHRSTFTHKKIFLQLPLYGCVKDTLLFAAIMAIHEVGVFVSDRNQDAIKVKYEVVYNHTYIYIGTA